MRLACLNCVFQIVVVFYVAIVLLLIGTNLRSGESKAHQEKEIKMEAPATSKKAPYLFWPESKASSFLKQ